MHKKYIVRLSDEERAKLTELTRKGKAAAYKIRHAHILLKADADGPAWTDDRIAVSFAVSVNTVRGVRQRLVEQELEAALHRKQQDASLPDAPRLDGAGEARSDRAPVRCATRRACPLDPVGSWPTRPWPWTLSRRSAMRRSDRRSKKCVETASAEDVGHSARAEWGVCGAYGRYLGGLPSCRMIPRSPLVCMDEQPVQLIKETRQPLRSSGHPRALRL